MRNEEQEVIPFDPLKRYLRNIGSVDLLTASEEYQLATMRDQGSMIRMLHNFEDGPLSPIEQQAVADGLKAQERMILSNTRLVVSIAKTKRGRGVDFDDLIDFGNEGLIRGVIHFDITMGNRLSTYVHWWINQCINRGIADTSRTIRLPSHAHDTQNSMRRVIASYTNRFQREPKDAEVADAMGIPLEKVQLLRKHMNKPLSLDSTPDDDDEDSKSLLNILRSSDEAPEDILTDEETRDLLMDYIHNSGLTDKEITIMSLWSGFEDGYAYTLEEIGKKYGVTREWIRILKGKALHKIGVRILLDRQRGYEPEF